MLKVQLLRVIGFATTLMHIWRKKVGIKIYLEPDTYALRLFFSSFKNNLSKYYFENRRDGKFGKDLFVDVGANIGWYSLCAAKAGYRVIAVEANPQTLRRLIRNIYLNGMQHRISAFQLAAHDSIECLKISNGISSDTNEISIDGYFDVLGVPLDSIVNLEQHESVHLKIDVEGSELKTLEGASRLLKSGKIKSVEIEIEKINYAKVVAIFIKNGFTLNAQSENKPMLNCTFLYHAGSYENSHSR